MKARTKRRLDRMHVWTHRRFHDATDPRFWRYWLAVRSKIIDLIIAADRTVSLDEWFQLDAAQKVADQGGMTLSWRREHGGIIIGMGRSNANITDKRRRPSGNPEHRPS